MASIKQRGRSFQVQIRRKESPTLSKCFSTLTEAKAWARQMESAIDTGKSTFASVRNSNLPTFGQALSRYEREVIPQKKCAHKELAFTRRLKAHTTAFKALSDITPQAAASLRDDLLKEGLANSSVVRHLAVVSHLFTMAIKEWGHNLDNPILKIRKPKVANARSRRPGASELNAILEKLPTDEMRAFVQLASETAMRRSELLNLTWEHVDMGRRFVFLPDTKNGTSRTVVFSTKAATLFVALGSPKITTGRVFSFTHEDTPSKAFRRALKLSRASHETQCKQGGYEPTAGYLQDLRLHDMRHEATSSLFERGLTSMEVASITGHKTLAMLQRYTHLSAAHLHAKLG